MGSCRLNVARLFVSRVCKEPQVHICPKTFVQDCRLLTSYVCYLSYFCNFYEKRQRNICIVLCFLTFCCFHAFISNCFGLKNARVFSKCFLSNVFCPCCRSFLGTKLVEEKPSEARTVYIIGSTLLVYKSRIDIWKTLAKSNNSLPKVNTIFNRCSIQNASNSRC